MPRYHFHLRDGRDYPDLQGTDLADLTAARKEALRFSGALLADADSRFWEGVDWSMTVTDAVGLMLFTLDFVATNAPSTGASVDGGPVVVLDERHHPGGAAAS